MRAIRLAATRERRALASRSAGALRLTARSQRRRHGIRHFHRRRRAAQIGRHSTAFRQHTAHRLADALRRRLFADAFQQINGRQQQRQWIRPLGPDRFTAAAVKRFVDCARRRRR